MKKLFIIVFVFWASWANSQSNISAPTLRFEEDSVLIGMPTPVSLTFKHDWEQEVVFPDSSFDFSPFEFYRKKAFPTSTKDSISTDSVVYWLTTFEIDLTPSLQLPVFIHTKKDSIVLRSNTDSIHLTEMIPVMSDSLQVIENTTPLPLEKAFNYPIVLSVGISCLLIVIILLLVFRKQIVRFFVLKRMKRRLQKFELEFDQYYGVFIEESSDKNLENVMVTWKKHLEKLEKVPYTKLSTKEIQGYIYNSEVIGLLKEIDGQIFGGMPMQNADLRLLKSFYRETYQEALKEIKNG